VVFYPEGASKGKAVGRLRKYYPGYRICMIGDDVGDLETLKYVDGFFAVGNAQKKVKNRSDYVAKGRYAKGVSEILRLLTKS
jgi:hydroxymethylpyrimidine pyrophosphatase-like HAD family hydrolase